MLPVVLAVLLLTAAVAIVFFRWFAAYRFTDAWRHGEFRASALSFLLWFGGLFGHRLPPPPQVRTEYTGSQPGGQPRPFAGPSGSRPASPLADDTPDEKQ